MPRSPQEVFSDHLAALAKRDVALILEDFGEDAVVLIPEGSLQGLPGVEAFYAQAIEGMPDLEITVTSSVFGGDVLLARWTATSSTATVNDGVDTFVITDGKIRVQSSWFTIEPKS